MTRWVRVALGVLVLGFLALRLGSAPVVEGLRATTPWALVIAMVVTALTTWCCARRWSVVAERFGVRLPVGDAYAAYYRSQLVNATLPGGVVGDVDRALTHGPRAVVWERSLGQVVQVALAVGVLLLVPSSVRWTAGPVALVLVVLLALGLLARRDLRRLRPASLSVTALSVGAVLGHLAIFVVAALAVGTGVPLTTLLPIGALVLVGSSIPANVAGWGPREGVAAWAFAATGAGAATGLAVAVTYGVMALVATLPGLVVLRRRVPAHA